jgi:hypothetical protein
MQPNNEAPMGLMGENFTRKKAAGGGVRAPVLARTITCSVCTPETITALQNRKNRVTAAINFVMLAASQRCSRRLGVFDQEAEVNAIAAITKLIENKEAQPKKCKVRWRRWIPQTTLSSARPY